MGGVCRTGGNIGKHTEKEKIGNFTLVQSAFAVGSGIGDCLNRGLNGLRRLQNLCGISIALGTLSGSSIAFTIRPFDRSLDCAFLRWVLSAVPLAGEAGYLLLCQR